MAFSSRSLTRERGQHLLLLGDLDREMRGDRVGELGIVVDLAGGADHFGRDLLVQLHVVLEVGDHRARQRLDLDLVLLGLGKHVGLGLVEVVAVGEARRSCARARALDQHLDGAVGQLQQLQHIGERADVVDRVGRRIVVGGIHLGGEQDLLVGAHHLFERLDRLFAADEERHDHVREHHDVAQRQDCEDAVAGSPGYFGHCPTFHVAAAIGQPRISY